MDITLSEKDREEMVARAMQRAEDQLVDEIKRSTWFQVRRDVRTAVIRGVVAEAIKKLKDHLLSQGYISDLAADAMRTLTTKREDDYGHTKLTFVEKLVREQVLDATKDMINAVALRMAERFSDVLNRELPKQP